MTARWEPLETAEEVVAAKRSGRYVELFSRVLGEWVESSARTQNEVAGILDAGIQYRAMIEDSK